MTTTIRTREPRELLALIPFQLGFQPRESAVVVSIRTQRSRVGLVARVDLEALTDPEQGPVLARSLVRHLVADGAGGVVLVLYSDLDLQQEHPEVARAAHDHLADAADHLLGEPSTWVVGPQGWYGLGCVDARCCPVGGRPPSDLEAAAVSAEMVLRGASVASCREDLGDVGRAGAADRRSARRAAARWSARRAACEGPEALHRWRQLSLDLWREALEGARDAPVGPGQEDAVPGAGRLPAATVLGRLRAGLEDVLVRDAVLLLLIPGTRRLPDRLVAGDAGEEVGAALQRVVDPSQGVPPDETTVLAAERLLRTVGAHAPGHPAVPTLLAVLAWWKGDGARAGVLLERALDRDPAYRLAVLVLEALAHGMPPGWLAPRGR
ncbi:hypothetical protein N866_03775 [Actinotalea ferrariae CF5-4]|uniref:DUF4192 domain-containing protein n=1 Tax=Actinotalea ferrariae CF5-4 TaxID=948458 RepID=A0A021VP74_9CELL|nr:DUF4192 domain-containing protein [Actinotalea ferrariae]EYR62994.1 hypothetical protein N866_03775 [Actinotalea ferrariae CF5-4]